MGDRGHPDMIRYNMVTAEKDQSKADMFNTFFTSVFTQPDPLEQLPNINMYAHPDLEHIELEVEKVCR